MEHSKSEWTDPLVGWRRSGQIATGCCVFSERLGRGRFPRRWTGACAEAERVATTLLEREFAGLLPRRCSDFHPVLRCQEAGELDHCGFGTDWDPGDEKAFALFPVMAIR